MSVHVFYWKRDKMRGLLSILSLFRNEFNKLNNTGARLLDSFLSHDIKITLKSHFWRKNFKMDVITLRY